MKKRQRFAALLLAAGMTVSVAAPLGAAAETTDKTADMTAFYQEWKSKYVRQNPYVTDETQYSLMVNPEKQAAASLCR